VEPKLNGWRCILFRTEDGVVLQAQSGRLITDRLPDLAEAAMQLEPGAVLDGEAIAYRGGRIDLGAMQSRALSSPRRAAALAVSSPATFAAFDLPQAPDGTDLRLRLAEDQTLSASSSRPHGKAAPSPCFGG
jgi:ATP-dependent DNA ligase